MSGKGQQYFFSAPRRDFYWGPSVYYKRFLCASPTFVSHTSTKLFATESVVN